MEEPKTRFLSITTDKEKIAVDSPFAITDDNYNHIQLNTKESVKHENKQSSYTLEVVNVNNQSENALYTKNTKPYSHSDTSNGSTFHKGHFEAEINTSSKVKIKVYKRRWYILFVYCVLSFTQSALWNTWGPIAQTSEAAFGWTDADVALLTNLGPIAFLVFVFVISWIVDTKGLRWSCLLTALVILLGAAVRCITSQSSYLKITAGVGQFLNGIGTPVAMGVPPVLSATWFPSHQRTLATAIASMLNIAGIAASFVIGPFIVPVADQNNRIDTGNLSVTTETSFLEKDTAAIPIYHKNTTMIDHRATIEKQQHDIMTLMYIECGWAAFVLLLVCAYFPAKPPFPPTLSAGVKRMDFTSGAKALLRNKVFWVIACSYGLSMGILGGWPGLLDIVLKPHGISEKDAGMVGFYSVVGGIVCALVVSRLTDMFSKYKRRFLLVLYCGSMVFLLLMNLILCNAVSSTPVTLTVTIVIGASFLTATTPVYFEMACENTYPVAEGITNFILTLVNNITSCIFLAVQMIPGVGTSWEGWCLFGAVILCLPGLFLMKEKTNRLNVDENIEEQSIGKEKF